jgi:hypothetical protein
MVWQASGNAVDGCSTSRSTFATNSRGRGFWVLDQMLRKEMKLPQRWAGLQVGVAYVLDIPSRKKKNVTLFKIVEGITPVRRAQLAAPRAVAKMWRNFSAKVAGENGF